MKNFNKKSSIRHLFHNINAATILFSLFSLHACAQKPSINDKELPSLKEVTRVESFLSSDSLKGRKSFSAEIQVASNFIEHEFKNAGLKPFFGNSYRQDFLLYTSKILSHSLSINGIKVPDSLYFIQSGIKEININSIDSFRIVQIGLKDLPNERKRKIIQYLQGAPVKENIMLLLDPTLLSFVKRLKTREWPSLYPNEKTILVLVAKDQPMKIELRAKNSIKAQALNNVVGILPGKIPNSKFVLFSAHYDHLGTGHNDAAMRQPVPEQDSIFNGANDDASGTTAVIELAYYFARKHDNSRNIIFATFTAEEIGEYGSQYFAKNIDAEQVAAMFNIEMIGTTSKWGKDAAYITGYEQTDFGKILQSNLKGSNFHFYPDPYPDQNLFYRSDNAQLALKGVPAHTISTSKMDDEHNYHTPQDEIGTLDLPSMTRIIDAIAISSSTIVSGKETPTRVKLLFQ